VTLLAGLVVWIAVLIRWVDRGFGKENRPGKDLRSDGRDKRQSDQSALVCRQLRMRQQQVDAVTKAKAESTRENAHSGDRENMLVACEQGAQRQQEVVRTPEGEGEPKRRPRAAAHRATAVPSGVERGSCATIG